VSRPRPRLDRRSPWGDKGQMQSRFREETCDCRVGRPTPNKAENGRGAVGQLGYSSVWKQLARTGALARWNGQGRATLHALAAATSWATVSYKVRPKPAALEWAKSKADFRDIFRLLVFAAIADLS